jgi:serine protease Do
VRFGITPGDYNDDKPGVLIGDVAKGWSAEKAGLKAGDRMTRWNGKDIPGVEGWMPFLADAKAGDKVQVTIIRDGKEQVVEVELMARDNAQK